MGRTISEFHVTTLFLDARSFADQELLHDELAFKLGLPGWYGRNLDALLDCLSSIGDPQSNLCDHWDWRTEKQLVLLVRDFSATVVDSNLMMAFLDVVAHANQRLQQRNATNRICIEFCSPDESQSKST
jgi:RNAse (barnase) inhibitor barstar